MGVISAPVTFLWKKLCSTGIFVRNLFAHLEMEGHVRACSELFWQYCFCLLAVSHWMDVSWRGMCSRAQLGWQPCVTPFSFTAMEKYAIVEFDDGFEMIPCCWITEDRNHASWPTFPTNEKFRKAVQKCVSQTDGWPLYEIKKILGTADTYEKGMKKLKKAEFVTDINSESEDDEA